MFGYFKGSAAHKLLVAIAKRLDGKLADDFSGIVVGGHRILYRHAQFGIVTGQTGGKYPRWNWGTPFGTTAHHRLIDYVLLHASRPEEAFFLVPVSKAQSLARAFPLRLNIAADPKKQSAIFDKIAPYAVSLAELKRVLHK